MGLGASIRVDFGVEGLGLPGALRHRPGQGVMEQMVLLRPGLGGAAARLQVMEGTPLCDPFFLGCVRAGRRSASVQGPSLDGNDPAIC